MSILSDHLTVIVDDETKGKVKSFAQLKEHHHIRLQLFVILSVIVLMGVISIHIQYTSEWIWVTVVVGLFCVIRIITVLTKRYQSRLNSFLSSSTYLTGPVRQELTRIGLDIPDNPTIRHVYLAVEIEKTILKLEVKVRKFNKESNYD